MLQKYEKEWKSLTQEVVTLRTVKQQVVALKLVLRNLQKMTDAQELTLTLVNSLIEYIKVYNNDKPSSHFYVKLDICFTTIGMTDIIPVSLEKKI